MPTILSTLANLAPGDPDTQWGSMTRLAPLVPYLILLSLIARLGHPSRASDAASDAAATNSRAVYYQASKDNDGALKADIRKLMAENERLLAQVAVNRGTSKGLLRALERSRTSNRASRRRTTHVISKIASLKAAYRSPSGKLSHTIAYDADHGANLDRLREENDVLRSDLDTSRACEVDLQARLDERDGLLQEALEGRYDLHLQRAEALSRAHELEKELAKVKDKLDQVVQRYEDQEVLVADQEALIADHEVVIADLSTQVKDMKARDDAHRDSVNAKLEAELEAVKTELATVTWERDDFETALEEVLEVTTTANEVVDEATLKLEELDSATATLKERHSQEVARLRADVTLKESAIVDLKETVASLSRQSSPAPQVSQSTTPPTSPTTLAHQLPTPEMPDLIRDDDNDSSSDSDSPPTTPVLDAAPFAEPAYSLPSPPPVEFNDEDDGELPITPFPRRLAPLRATTYCPRPMLRAGILIRQAMVTCKQAVPALPEAEMDAVACLEWIASEPPPPASPRAYRLRDEREFEVVGCWIPRPVEVEDAPLPLRDRRPLDYGPHSRRGVNRLGGSRIPVACYT